MQPVSCSNQAGLGTSWTHVDGPVASHHDVSSTLNSGKPPSSGARVRTGFVRTGLSNLNFGIEDTARLGSLRGSIPPPRAWSPAYIWGKPKCRRTGSSCSRTNRSAICSGTNFVREQILFGNKFCSETKRVRVPDQTADLGPGFKLVGVRWADGWVRGNEGGNVGGTM